MIREIIAAIFIVLGVFCITVSVLGIYRFKYVLNRLHAAAITDTMGILLCQIGLFILANDFSHKIRLLLLIVLLWLASPVSTHVIAKCEILTNPKNDEKVRRKHDT